MAIYMCQCPERGDLHFYGLIMKKMDEFSDCVNALKGATFISTGQKISLKVLGLWCQCPERGDLHFYEVSPYANEDWNMMCQCPERGDLHFYRSIRSWNSSANGCVNALKGATFISTPSALGTRINKGFADPFLQKLF